MKCRNCDSKNTRVICTDHFLTQTKRYCRCLDCGAKYQTIEQYAKPKPGPPKGATRSGNIARGSRTGNAIFTEEDVLGMRNLHRQGKTHKEISAIYGASSDHISRIVNYKLWKHVA